MNNEIRVSDNGEMPIGLGISKSIGLLFERVADLAKEQDLQKNESIEQRIEALEARAVKQSEMIELLATKTTTAVEQYATGVASALRQIIDRVGTIAENVRCVESVIVENTCLDYTIPTRLKDLESKMRNCIKTFESMGGAK